MIKVSAKPILIKRKTRRKLTRQKKVNRQALIREVYDLLGNVTNEEILFLLDLIKEVKGRYVYLSLADKRKFYKLVLFFDLKGYVDVNTFLSRCGLKKIEVFERMKSESRTVKLLNKDYIYFLHQWKLYGKMAEELHKGVWEDVESSNN